MFFFRDFWLLIPRLVQPYWLVIFEPPVSIVDDESLAQANYFRDWFELVTFRHKSNHGSANRFNGE